MNTYWYKFKLDKLLISPHEMKDSSAVDASSVDDAIDIILAQHKKKQIVDESIISSVSSYQWENMVRKLAKPGVEILRELTDSRIDLLHAAVGICGEAGELLDSIKKHVIYNKPIDLSNIIEELGDLEFYMEQLRSNTGVLITRDHTLKANYDKLSKRYSSGSYSDSQAQTRADKISD